MTEDNHAHATKIAFWVSDPEIIGEAYIIALRSPHLSAEVVKRAAEVNVAQDTVDRKRKRKDGSRRRQYQYDEQTDNRAECGSTSERISNRQRLAERIIGELGDVGQWLANGDTAAQCAERLGMHPGTLSRRLSSVAERYREEFTECGATI